MNITEEDASKVIDLLDGRKILLFGWKTKEDERPTSRNIYMIQGGKIIWRVRSDRDDSGDPFTNLWMDGNDIHAYRWDGFEYSIDPKNGFAIRVRFLK